MLTVSRNFVRYGNASTSILVISQSAFGRTQIRPEIRLLAWYNLPILVFSFCCIGVAASLDSSLPYAAVADVNLHDAGRLRACGVLCD